MIKRAEKVIPGLSSHIVYQELWTPETIDQYAMSGTDASIGWALSPQQVGPKRLAQQTPVKNLFLSGHWTQPAIGVMSTVISGLKAARMIMSCEGGERITGRNRYQKRIDGGIDVQNSMCYGIEQEFFNTHNS